MTLRPIHALSLATAATMTAFPGSSSQAAPVFQVPNQTQGPDPAPAVAATVLKLESRVSVTQQALDVGDLNYDGCQDIVLGIPGDSTTPGSVLIQYGASPAWEASSPSSPCRLPASGSTQQTLTGAMPVENLNDQFAAQVLIANVNGDDFDDLIVSAYRADDPSLRGAVQAGVVYVFLGSDEGITAQSVAEADVLLHGTQSNEFVGYGLGRAGNVYKGNDNKPGKPITQELWVASLAPMKVMLWPGDGNWSTVGNQTAQVSTQDLKIFEVSATSSSNKEGFGRNLQTQWIDSDHASLLLTFYGYGNPYNDGVVWRVPITFENPLHAVTDPGVDAFYGARGSQSYFGWSAALMSPGIDVLEPSQLVIGAPEWRDLQQPGAPCCGQIYSPDTGGLFSTPDYPDAGNGFGLGVALAPFRALSEQSGGELLVGNAGDDPTFDDGGVPKTHAGRVYLMQGEKLDSSGTFSLDPLASWEGVAPGDEFGASVVSGDFNGDNQWDMAVLAPMADHGNGVLYIVWSVSQTYDGDGDGYAPYHGSATPDCDDKNPAVNPGVPELCNGVDDNCLEGADEGFDHDNDGVTTCGPDGEAGTADDDCDDALSSINPNVTEACNGKDDNCDGQIDEGTQATYYLDADQDQYGDPAISTLACIKPNGYVSDDTDCDDVHAGAHPSHSLETSSSCDGLDNDCNGQIDDGAMTTFYLDCDGDEHGDPDSGNPVQACLPPAKTADDCRYVVLADDCNDHDITVYPGAPATAGANGGNTDCSNDTFETYSVGNLSRAHAGDGCGSIDLSRGGLVLGGPLLLLRRRRARAHRR